MLPAVLLLGQVLPVVAVPVPLHPWTQTSNLFLFYFLFYFLCILHLHKKDSFLKFCVALLLLQPTIVYDHYYSSPLYFYYNNV